MSKVRFKNRYPPISGAILEGVARALGDTEHGLTGTEIERLLEEVGVEDPAPGATKWKRLHDAFAMFQNEHQVSNHVLLFIGKTMEPARYTTERGKFSWRLDRLNQALAFAGYRVEDDGKVRRGSRASTLDDAARLAGRLRAELGRREVHPIVLRFCDEEFLKENLFHAVLEAMKSITSRLRRHTGLSGDGAKLVQDCFAGDAPRVRINGLNTDTDRGEQRGFLNLLTGLYGMFRNPTAHEAKIEWELSEQDALDVLTTISMVHRKLDRAIPVEPR